MSLVDTLQDPLSVSQDSNIVACQAQIVHSSEASFEVNSKMHSPSMEKADLRKFNQEKYWQKASSNLHLVDARQKGFGIRHTRNGMREDGKDEIETSFIILDHDDDDGWTLEKILNHPFIQKNAWFVEGSYSHDPVTAPYKWHLIFKLNRSYSSDELPGLIEWLRSQLHGIKITNESAKPLQIWYAPRLPENVHLISDTNVLDISEIELTAGVGVSKTNLNQPKSRANQPAVSSSGTSGIWRQVEQHIYEPVFIGKFGGDAIALYTQHWHGCGYTSVPTEPGEILRFQTHNPFSENAYEDQSGTSLLVIHDEDRLPRCIDRSNTQTNGKGKNHGTFIDYFWQWRCRDDDEFKTLFGDARDPQNGNRFKDGFYAKLVSYICKFYDVPQFDFTKSNQRIVKAVIDTFKDQLFILNGSLKGDSFQMFVYDESDCRSIQTDSEGWAVTLLANRVIELYPDFEQYINYQSPDQQRKSRKDRTVAGYLREYIYNRVNEVYAAFPKVDRFHAVDDLIPIDGVVLDVKTKEFSPNVGQAKNTCLPYTGIADTIKLFLAEPETVEQDPDIQLFVNFWHKWTGCEVKGRLLLLWFILNVCRMAHKSRRAIAMTAPTKSGKSTYFKLIQAIMNQGSRLSIATQMGSEFFSDNPHLTQQLEGLYFLFLDEIKDVNPHTFVGKIKTFCQDEDILMQVNPKGLKGYLGKFNFSISCAIEEKMLIATDQGADGRFVYVSLEEVHKDTEGYARLQTREVQNKILAYCLTRDVDAVMAEFKVLADHNVFKQALKEKKLDSDVVFQFIKECINFTNNESDTLLPHQMFSSFNAWYRGIGGDNYTQLFKNQATFMRDFKPTIQQFNELEDTPIDTKFLPKRSKTGMIYCGVKFKDQSPDIPADF